MSCIRSFYRCYYHSRSSVPHFTHLVWPALALVLAMPFFMLADESAREALDRGNELLQKTPAKQDNQQRHVKISNLNAACESALTALRRATTPSERAQAATLLEQTLARRATLEKDISRERLTLQLQAVGAKGLSGGDIAAIEKAIQAVIEGVDDPIDTLLDGLAQGELPSIHTDKNDQFREPPKVSVADRVAALWDAAVFFVRAREYEVARVFDKQKRLLHASCAMPLNHARCAFVDKAPSGVDAWAASEIVADKGLRFGGFYPVPRENAALDPALWDILWQHPASSDERDAMADKHSAFYTVYDPRGWHLYLETERCGGRVDLFFADNMRHINPVRCRFHLPNGDGVSSDLAGGFSVETKMVGSKLCTAIFIPWTSLYNRLPFNEERARPWGFTIVRGELTWGGREREPGRWGSLEWQPPTPQQRLAIMRHLAGEAAKKWRDSQHGVLERLRSEMPAGDLFYKNILQPLAARCDTLLEAAAKPETEALSAESIEAIYDQLPMFFDFAGHVEQLRGEWLLRQLTQADEADGVAGDLWRDAAVTCHRVAPLGNINLSSEDKPPPGSLSDQLLAVGAPGEYVPLSFLVAPQRAVEKLEVTAGPLRALAGSSDKESIAAENIDLRVVKCWWQPGRSWYSYADDYTRRELMPDLLLHDDDLIKVDMKEQEHYVRAGSGSNAEYLWASYSFPRKIAGYAIKIDHIKEQIRDAPKLLPLKVAEGEMRQFWVTLHIPSEAAPGLYEGTLAIQADGASAGAMRLRLRVLPFALPDPATAYNLEQRFLVGMDGLGTLRNQIAAFDGDEEAAERRLRILFKNQRAHNINFYSALNIPSCGYAIPKTSTPETPYALPNIMADAREKAILARNLEMVREAGFQPPLMAAARADITYNIVKLRANADEYSKEELDAIYKSYMDAAKEFLELMNSVLGHREAYFWGSGEPSPPVVAAQLEGFRALKELGIKIGSEGQPWMVESDEGVVDLVNLGGAFFDHKFTHPWHKRGGLALWYAGPHPGAKNPDKSRRVHGMMGYQAHFDGTKNNTWGDTWLDFHSRYGYHIRMIYPTCDGVLDTLQWEGFRAGIDDIRYATCLRLAAARALGDAAGKLRDEASAALQWLDGIDAARVNLDTFRLETVERILRLSNSNTIWGVNRAFE